MDSGDERVGCFRTKYCDDVAGGRSGEKLEAIAAAGFDGVEIFENDFLTFNAAPPESGGW